MKIIIIISPASLPLPVLETAKDELLNWNGTGVSVMEMSHRSKHFESILFKAQDDLRYILQIPNNYTILFQQGGKYKRKL
jgi:phosphoserine aminotransferase